MIPEQAPLLSVIVPVYNVEAYLEECVRSLLRQTYPNLELLLVDDGSTDGSGAICDRFAAENPRIRTLHTEHRGPGAARNAGLAIAAGELLGFVDADDFCDAAMYMQLAEAMFASGAQVAICGWYYVREDRITTAFRSQKTRELSREEALKLLLEDRTFGNFAWNRLYRREPFDTIRFPEGMVYEDMVISHLLLERAEKTVFLDRPLYFYRIRPGSITHTTCLSSVCDYHKMLELKFEYSGASGGAYPLDENCFFFCSLITMFLAEHPDCTERARLLAWKQEFFGKISPRSLCRMDQIKYLLLRLPPEQYKTIVTALSRVKGKVEKVFG